MESLFVIGSYIQRLAPMLHLPPETDDTGWSAQKVSNIHCMLQVIYFKCPEKHKHFFIYMLV